MQILRTLDCSGLSTASAVLRIKQALVGRTEDNNSPIGVLIGSQCDHERIAGSLGPSAGRIRLMHSAKP